MPLPEGPSERSLKNLCEHCGQHGRWRVQSGVSGGRYGRGFCLYACDTHLAVVIPPEAASYYGPIRRSVIVDFIAARPRGQVEFVALRGPMLTFLKRVAKKWDTSIQGAVDSILDYYRDRYHEPAVKAARQKEKRHGA